MQRPQYITEKEASEILQISASKLQSDRYHGTGLPFYKLGNRTVRYDIKDIRAFMDERRIQHD